MINPYKNSEGLNNFFVSLDSNVPMTDSRSNPKCKLDMDWVYNKCMMRSKEYREMLENNNKSYVIIHPLIKKDPEAKKYVKKRVMNSYDTINGFNVSVASPVFNNCALTYQEHCRRFYEKNGLEKRFQLD